MKNVPLANCASCPLLNARGPVFGSGNPNAELVLVGEAPGATEIVEGQPFVGESGRLLNELLAVGVETYKTNAVLCKPSGTEVPRKALECCAPRLHAELAGTSGRLVALGGTALEALDGQGLKITTSRGTWRKYRGRDMIATYHPAFVLRVPSAIVELDRDLRKALKPVPPPLKEFEINVIRDVPDVEGLLAVDVEVAASGELLCIGYAWGSDISQAGVLVPPFTPTLKICPPKAIIVMHNGKFDVQVLRKAGFEARCDFDTMLAHYALDERGGKLAANDPEVKEVRAKLHGLKVLAKEYFDAPSYDDWKKVGRTKVKDFATVPKATLHRYCMLDAHFTWRLADLLKDELAKAPDLQRMFYDILMPASEAYTLAEERGIHVDLKLLDELDAQLQDETTMLEMEMFALVGRPFNPRSVPQLRQIMYVERKLTPPKVEAGLNYGRGAMSTDKAALKLNEHDEFVQLLARYRRRAKLKSSYVDVLRENCVDGVFHFNVAIHGTETGRVSSYLHTIPRDDDKEEGQLGTKIKNLFVATPGYLLVLSDLSQAEMRIAAALSGDPVLLDIFEKGLDPHATVAKRVFGPQAGSEERYAAKAVNFGFIYGGRRDTLVRRLLEIRAGRPSLPADPEAIGAIVDEYFQVMKGLAAFRDECIKQAHTRGYVETVTGRRRRFPLITRDNLDEIHKAALNSRIQGSASDVSLIAFNELSAMGFRTIVSIHDSVLVEVPESTAERDAQVVLEKVLEVARRLVPNVRWEADVKVGPRWGTLKKL